MYLTCILICKISFFHLTRSYFLSFSRRPLYGSERSLISVLYSTPELKDELVLAVNRIASPQSLYSLYCKADNQEQHKPPYPDVSLSVWLNKYLYIFFKTHTHIVVLCPTYIINSFGLCSNILQFIHICIWYSANLNVVPRVSFNPHSPNLPPTSTTSAVSFSQSISKSLLHIQIQSAPV